MRIIYYFATLFFIFYMGYIRMGVNNFFSLFQLSYFFFVILGVLYTGIFYEFSNIAEVILFPFYRRKIFLRPDKYRVIVKTLEKNILLFSSLGSVLSFITAMGTLKSDFVELKFLWQVLATSLLPLFYGLLVIIFIFIPIDIKIEKVETSFIHK